MQMLCCPARSPFELLQPIRRRHPQVVEHRRRVEHPELAPYHALDVRSEPLDPLPAEETLGVPLRLGEGERSQEHPVHDTEDRRGGARRQREREDGGDGEDGVPGERAPSASKTSPLDPPR
jgi:hypothetical protein